MATLTYKNRLEDQVTIELNNQRISIGRSSQNDVVLNHRSISRHHAELVADDSGRYQVLDLGSKNGVLLNGNRIGVRSALANGDRLILGEKELIFALAVSSPPVTVGEASAIARPVEGFPEVDHGARTDMGTVVVPVEDILTTLGSPGGPALPRSAAAWSGTVDGPESRSKRLARLSTVINRTALALISNRPLPDIFELVLDLVFDSLPIQRGCLMLFDTRDVSSEKAPIVQEVISRRQKNTNGDAPFSPSQTILRQVVNQRVSLLTRDAMLDERFDAAQSVVTQGIRSAMCVPLWSRTEGHRSCLRGQPQPAEQFRP